MCDPILVTLLKIRPRYSQSSLGHCDPNQRHIPISLNTPHPTPVGFRDDLNMPLRVRSFDMILIRIIPKKRTLSLVLSSSKHFPAL